MVTKVNENEAIGAKIPESKPGRPVEEVTVWAILPPLNHMTVVPGDIVMLAGQK